MERRRREKVKYYDDPVALGRRLRETREAASLSQRELSFPGCTAAYISRIEKGERVPSLQLIREFASRLGVTEEFISHGDHRPQNKAASFVEARVALWMDEADVALELANAALDGAKSNADRARASALFGEIDLHKGNLAEAIDALERARTLDPHLEADDPQFAESLGRAYARAIEYESSIAVFERNRDRAQQDGDPVNELRFSSLLANAYSDSGNFPAAEAAIARAINLSEQVEQPYHRAKALWAQSRLRSFQKDPEGAARYAQRALEILEVADQTFHAGLAHLLLAHIELDRGNAERAHELLERGEPTILASGRANNIAAMKVDQAWALAQLGESERAAATAMEAVGLLKHLGSVDAARGYVIIAGIYESLGEDDRALEVYELALELEDVQSRYSAEAYSKYAALLERRGDKDKALEVLKRAMNVTTETRSRP
ncbi:MAG TPA: tetratricopeptide repeat protein [Gaiellaceae bacterium]|nr:tetratricopeptide repeat protein [Gaiellaceae bacterium]